MLSSSMATSTMSSFAARRPGGRAHAPVVGLELDDVDEGEVTQEQGEQGGGQADAGPDQGFAHAPRE